MSILSYIFFGLMTLAVALGMYFQVLKKLPVNMLPIVLATAASLIDEILAFYFSHKFHNNLMVYYFGNCIEYNCFAWFICANIANTTLKKLIKSSIVAYSLIIVAFAVPYLKEDPYAKIIIHDYFIVGSSFLLCVWSIFYFRDIFNRISKFEYLDVYALLIVSGILFYFAFSTIFFAARNYLITMAIKENPHLFTDVVKIKSAAFPYAYQQVVDVNTLLFITNILMYLCILVGIAKSPFTQKKYTAAQGYSL